jgi:hypothetical protein
MGLFNRKNARNDAGSDSGSSEQKKEKGGWKRPASKLQMVFLGIQLCI